MQPIRTSELATVDAGAWYDAPAVGRLFGRSARTVRRWMADGLLPCRTDPFDHRRQLALGRDILVKAAGLMIDAAPPAPAETERQRERRARRDLDEIEELLRSRRG